MIPAARTEALRRTVPNLVFVRTIAGADHNDLYQNSMFHEAMLNPIEEMFSKLKRLLRKANERTVEATWRRIGNLLDHFPPHEGANYIRGAGYASI